MLPKWSFKHSNRRKGNDGMTSIVTLLVDGKDVSREAQKLLRDADIPFNKVFGHGVNLPKAQYNHISYIGISGIQLLVNSMAK